MHWQDLTYPELEQIDRETTVVILPVGAIEAHGPHLPTGTDNVIAEGVAERCAQRLPAHGLQAIILPTLPFTVAGFARNFAGTLGFSETTVCAWFADLGRGLVAQGWKTLAVANAHLDPGHLGCLQKALQDFPLAVAFPDLTRRRWASRLTEEFQSGACHAGQYEGSIVLARRPDLVRNLPLPDNPNSLLPAIRQGLTTFEEAGGPQAYFGYPRLATAEEGQASLDTLAEMLVEAILEGKAAS